MLGCEILSGGAGQFPDTDIEIKLQIEGPMAPPKRNTTGVLVRLHERTLDAIDDLIAKAGDDPSRPEMIRRLVKGTLTEKGYDLKEWVD